MCRTKCSICYNCVCVLINKWTLFYMTADFGVSSQGTTAVHKCNSFKGTPYWWALIAFITVARVIVACCYITFHGIVIFLLLVMLWPGGVLVRVLDLWLKWSQGRLSAVPRSGNSLGPVVYTFVSVTKQYNLVLVKWWWRPAAGEVTICLASHWPCVTDLSGLSTDGLTA